MLLYVVVEKTYGEYRSKFHGMFATEEKANEVVLQKNRSLRRSSKTWYEYIPKYIDL